MSGVRKMIEYQVMADGLSCVCLECGALVHLAWQSEHTKFHQDIDRLKNAPSPDDLLA